MDGATLELDETETAPTVEDALAQASLLINGGGLDQLQTITEELNTALGGNEDDVRLLLNQASTFLTQASATTSSIDAVLTSLNSLSGTLNDRQDVINRAMKEIRPAAAVLRRATPELTGAAEGRPAVLLGGQQHRPRDPPQLFALLAETEPVLASWHPTGAGSARCCAPRRRGRRTARRRPGRLRVDLPGPAPRRHPGGQPAGLQNLLDLLGITAPIVDVIDALGLGDLLGGLGAVAPRRPRPASPDGTDTARRTGRRQSRSTRCRSTAC